MHPALQIFAKAPERGRVKTRLATVVGVEEALRVYQALLTHTGAVAAAWPGVVTVHVAGAGEGLSETALGGFPQEEQVGVTLGDRLAHGLGLALDRHEQAVAIGTDCPGISVTKLQAACRHLEEGCDAAVGPTPDGGYWCLALADRAALRVCCAADLPWSQPELLEVTRERCAAGGIHLGLGPQLQDIDDAADLRLARAAGFRW